MVIYKDFFYLTPLRSFEHSQSKAPVSVFQAQSPLAFPKALHLMLQKDRPPNAQVVSLFSRWFGDPVFLEVQFLNLRKFTKKLVYKLHTFWIIEDQNYNKDKQKKFHFYVSNCDQLEMWTGIMYIANVIIVWWIKINWKFNFLLQNRLHKKNER